MTAPSWSEVGITPTCDVPPDKGTIKLPAGTTIPADKLLVRKKIAAGAAPKVMLLDARLREDEAGRGACLERSTVNALGGENARIEYRAASTWELYRYQPGLIWKSILAILSAIGAGIGAWSGFLATRDPKTIDFDVATAGVVLALACITALNDLVKGLRGGD
jgi:hypothetical protein